MLAHNKAIGLLAISVAAILLMVAPAALADGPVTLNATLILASNEQSAQDPRLDNIEYKLRRIFGFEYYRYYGGGSAVVNLPGESTLSLGQGCRLDVSASDAGKGRVRVNVQWFRDGDMVLNTTAVLSRGTPVILGGVSQGKGTLIVTLTAQ